LKKIQKENNLDSLLQNQGKIKKEEGKEKWQMEGAAR